MNHVLESHQNTVQYGVGVYSMKTFIRMDSPRGIDGYTIICIDT